MSSPEFYGGQSDLPFVRVKQVDIPYDADKTWCRAFTECYGQMRLRALVEVGFYIAPKVPIHDCQRLPRHVQYEQVRLAEPGELVPVEGEVRGATMIALECDFDDGPEYVSSPYLIMYDLIHFDTGHDLSDAYNTKLYVPITGIKDSIQLFSS